MSITTLKRKTDGQYHLSGGKHGMGFRNVISHGIFSLNDPRRVEAHTGEPSLQTRMRGTGYRGHGTANSLTMGTVVRSSYQNMYDPFDKARVSRPKPVPACPVVQAGPVTAEELRQDLAYYELKKELCNPATPGTCIKTCTEYAHSTQSRLSKQANIVKKMTHSYQDVLTKRKRPLPPGKEHYPPRVSRNSTFTTVPNFTYIEFLKRSECKPYVPSVIEPTVVTSKNNQWYINGLANPTLQLTRGKSYTFKIESTNVTFYIRSILGPYNEGTIYNDGVTNNGALYYSSPSDYGTLVFAVPLNAPDTLYYDTPDVSGMSGMIKIV